uniref:40S ribosomal protein S26 n=1 Tax=Caenorhabditis tropicalis TaxID=1561998 RepID=A0A1I7UVP0_9PELO
MVCRRCRPFHGKRQSVIMHTKQGTSSKNVPTVGERKKNAPPITIRNYCGRLKTDRKKGKRLQVILYDAFDQVTHTF